MDKKLLTPEEKILKQEQRLAKKQERNKALFEKAYSEALKDQTLPEFRIVDNILLIKRFSKSKFNNLKKSFKTALINQINNYTFEDLCEDWNGYFQVDTRSANPSEIIRFYFYHKYGIDFLSLKINYKIVDNF